MHDVIEKWLPFLKKFIFTLYLNNCLLKREGVPWIKEGGDYQILIIILFVKKEIMCQ